MEVVDINYVGSTPDFQEYSREDQLLITKRLVELPFGSSTDDYIEYFIYDPNSQIIASNYFVQNYTPQNNQPTTDEYTVVNLNPEGDVRANGFSRGNVSISYNFFRKLFSSSYVDRFWIGEISSDRTEIRTFRQDMSNAELQASFNNYQSYINNVPYYPDFYLDFGLNKNIIGVNILYADSSPQASLLFKLYEPLPVDVKVKDTFWVVDKISESARFNVSFTVSSTSSADFSYLRGPNYNVEINKATSQLTPYYNYDTLISSALTSSFQQLKSMMDEKGLDINVDYTNFENFIHFHQQLRG